MKYQVLVTLFASLSESAQPFTFTCDLKISTNGVIFQPVPTVAWGSLYNVKALFPLALQFVSSMTSRKREIHQSLSEQLSTVTKTFQLNSLISFSCWHHRKR